MKIIVTDTYEEMSEYTALLVFNKLQSRNPKNIAITGGRTPARMYEKLVDLVKKFGISKNITFHNFDEIPFGKTEREGYTITDLRNYFFTPAKIDESQIYVLDENNYLKFDDYLLSKGGMDFILIGIGADGHYCGNLPHTTKFEDLTSRVEISGEEKDRIGYKHFGDDVEEHPDYYITMGPRSVMNSQEIVLIANSLEKAEIIQRVIEGDVDVNIPASLLKLHPNLTIILDKEAASKLDKKTIEKYGGFKYE